MAPGRARGITAAQQYIDLRACAICSGAGTLRLGVLKWTYWTAPTPLSRSYKLRVEFHQGGIPKVFVEQPDLVLLAEGRRLPHVYNQTPTQLCLYLPASGEWNACMRISQTFVPWAALWLLYFEEWLVSNDWKGGGEHPRPLRPRNSLPH